MGLQENMSIFMHAERLARNVSTSEFSDELGISRSALQEYLNGTGNPSLLTIEHLAKQLNVDPVMLLSGSVTTEQRHIIRLLTESVNAVAQLPPEKQKRFVDLLLQVIALWEN